MTNFLIRYLETLGKMLAIAVCVTLMAAVLLAPIIIAVTLDVNNIIGDSAAFILIVLVYFLGYGLIKTLDTK